MIRVRLDASFPESAELHSLPRLRFEPVDPQAVLTDKELIEQAAADGIDAVAFLGREMLAQPGVLESARRSGVCVLVTHTDDPVAGQEHLARRARDLLREIGPGRILVVLASEVRPVLDDLVGPKR